MRVPKRLLSALRKEQSFVLAAHIGPDGDAIGACLALAGALRHLGKTVVVYSHDPVPDCYRFMPGQRTIRRSLPRFPEPGPSLVLLDCNSPDRAGLEGKSFALNLVIDHHETESSFGDIRWVERTAAATGLMVFYLIKALKVPLTTAMATNLYTAIAVDTGTFRYSNTQPDVLHAAADLIAAGARPGIISERLYEQWQQKRFDLLTLALGTLSIDNGLAVMQVTGDMFRRTGTVESDTENFANFPRMIDSVKISAVIRETGDGRWKVSMRSKGNANVAGVAASFGGGGHRNAAGFRMRGDLAQVTESLVIAARKVLYVK